MTKSTVCSIEGCGKDAYARGRCRSHDYRWKRYGDPLGGGTWLGATKAFLSEAIKSDIADCIIWPFRRTEDGYGTIAICGRSRRAHRLVCAAVHGDPPTPLHQAAHLCGNAGCINPKHLAWKTAKENRADRVAHGTDDRGEKNVAAKLTEAQVLEIRRLKGRVTQEALGERFGVHAVTIGKIHNRKKWAHLS